MKLSTPEQYALIGLGAVALLWWAGKQAGQTVAGIATGNNALTQGTPYQGAGIFGTLGAATNAVSGGILQTAGEKVGGWIYDLTHAGLTSDTTSSGKIGG